MSRQRCLSEKFKDKLKGGSKIEVYNWRMREARYAKDYIMQKLAEEVSVAFGEEITPVRLYMYERLSAFPQSDLAEKIGEVLEVDAGYLFDRGFEEFRNNEHRNSEGLRYDVVVDAENLDDFGEERFLFFENFDEDLLERIKGLLNVLTEDERKVIEGRYFVVGQMPFQKEIADEMEITNGRVSQLERKGVEKLRIAYRKTFVN